MGPQLPAGQSSGGVPGLQARALRRRRSAGAARIAGLYRQRLGDLAELLLPPGPDGDPDHFDVFQNYEIEAERRDDLRAYLKDAASAR